MSGFSPEKHPPCTHFQAFARGGIFPEGNTLRGI